MATSSICSWPGCSKPRNATYLMCTMHYQRSVKGTPMDAPEKTSSGLLKAFIEASILIETNECVIWPYGKDKDGYAKWSAGQALFGTNRVYRIVCMKVHGPAPTTRHQAAHSCGKGHMGCINKRHVRWATPVENAEDSLRLGTTARGELSGMAKLTDGNVRDILARLEQGENQYALAAAFGVAQTMISRIKRRKAWTHI